MQVVKNLKYLKLNTRIPNKYKNQIRREKKSTFIYPNTKSFRVISKFDKHFDFVNKFNILYSTSANKSNKSFDEQYAIDKSDIIIYTKDEFQEYPSSSIYKVSNYKIKKIRA